LWFSVADAGVLGLPLAGPGAEWPRAPVPRNIGNMLFGGLCFIGLHIPGAIQSG